MSSNFLPFNLGWEIRFDPNNRKFIARTDDTSIAIRDITKHNEDVSVLINSEGDGKTRYFSVSKDNKYVVYFTYDKRVWGDSYEAHCSTYQIVENNIAGSKVDIPGFPSDGMIQNIQWSPGGHILAYVYKWNIYIVNFDSLSITQVTNDGNENQIYNGIPDWVYEQEMIKSNNVLYWSPSSTSFAFLKTNDEDTHLIEYSMYNDAQYPETIRIAYPKAGTTNPTVQMFVYDIATTSTDELSPKFPTSGIGNFSEYYFSRFTWIDDNTCFVTWIDRSQKHSVGNKCTKSDTTSTWTCVLGLGSQEQVNENEGWIGMYGPFDVVFKSGNPVSDYFTIYARPNDDDSSVGRWQIARVTADLETKTWITKTNYDIIELLYYDEKNEYIYFLAAAPEPRERHIFRTNVDVTDNGNPDCMTCYLDKVGYYENRCGWLEPVFNIDGSMVVINCRGYWIPVTVSIEISSDGIWQKETVLEENAVLQNRVAEKKWPTKEYGSFPSVKYPGKEMRYEMFKPSDFDPNKKYPILIEAGGYKSYHRYGGQDYQTVTDVWTRGWSSTHMVSDKQVVTVSIDERGTYFEGFKYMRESYGKMGQIESVDHVDFIQWLIDNNDWVDADHIGMWGWGYGGYVTTQTIGYDGGNYIKCGIAVAPITDWNIYDSMFTERHMGMPSVNQEGYQKGSAITGPDLNQFKSAEYVLIHGTADDNVHFQHSAELEKALVEADVDFDDFFYADQDHVIGPGNTDNHLYRQLTIRMSHCLGRSDKAFP